MVQPKTTEAAGGTPERDAELERLRGEIDEVDRSLLAALNRRARLVESVGRLKRDTATEVYEPTRERRIVERLQRENSGPFPDAALAPVFREIISATRSLEEPVQIAYLGPEGTYTHQAARHQFGEQAQLASAPTIPDVFAAVEAGKVELGVVPVENTTEGVVTQTLDALAQFDVGICAEIALPISHELLSRSGRLEDVRQVASHPQPLAQCRRWLERHLPEAERVETASTAAAARRAAEDPQTAAIGSSMAGEVYGLRSIESGIEDRRDNRTRFLVLGKQQPPPSGNDLTSAVFTIRRDQPGGLFHLLEPFARAGVNLTSIQLRPMHGKPWEYLFFIDVEGHRSVESVARALEGASQLAYSSRVLGSFPRAALDVGRGGG
jgi:chorismate mutase/prephenate dehydratase